MGNPILGERVRVVAASEEGGGDGLPHVEGAHGLACVCVRACVLVPGLTNASAHSHASERKG